MRVVLASIVLNEADMIECCYKQHCNWPGLKGWIFVEGADPSYAKANPGAVTKDGHSTDKTREAVSSLLSDRRVVFLRHGWAEGPVGQAKCVLRNRYLEAAESFQPDLLVAVDLDERYTQHDQYRVNRLGQAHPGRDAFVLKQRHLWRPPSLAGVPPERYEAVGAYFDVPHCRVWRHKDGMRHLRNHNTPEHAGRFLSENAHRAGEHDPQVVHLGFARTPESRLRTNKYYVERGEGKPEADGADRSMYVRSRAAWENWKEGEPLPDGGKVVPYRGPVPEFLF